MKRSIRAAAAVAAALFVAVAASKAHAGVPAHFRRGIGIIAMAWAAVEPQSPRTFVFPPFVGPSYALTAGELRTLRRSGFDFVRLAVDPGPFLQFEAAQRDALDRILLERVRLILGSGLSAVVDFHPSDMNPTYVAGALTAGTEAPVFQSYLRMVRHTAGLLGQLHSSGAALELMNEPPVAPQAWQPMLEAVYAAARSGSPDLLLVLDGGDEASPAALLQMDTAPFARDPNVFYSFHYYEPYQFTHQGASWNPARYLADVPYPADAHPLNESLTASAAAIAATNLSEPQKSLADQDAQARLEDYLASGFDAGTIAASFGQIADWAHTRGIPADRIMLGEFGARRTALQRSGERARERAQRFHDVRKAAESMGFSWAVWAYRGGDFGLAPCDGGDGIEPDIAAALGLNSAPLRKAADVPTATRNASMP